MSDGPRYAIYFVPAADSLLYRFGSRLLGYDCYSGLGLDPPSDAGLPDDWGLLTNTPRKYGFHGTLTAPFHLADGYDEAGLSRAFVRFCQQERELAAIQPVVRALGDFNAIVAAEPSVALDQLAADCVKYFDSFRAPLSDADRERRRTSGLSERERSNLERWGYPYVFDDFRFHMTLTGAVDDDRRATIGQLLAALLQRYQGDGIVPIDHLALLRQDHVRAHFRVLRDAMICQDQTYA